jgi:hypothetical protein
MTGAACPFLAPFTGSTQSLSRSLSPLHRVPEETSPATPPRQLSSRSKAPTHPPTRSFSPRSRHRNLQNTIQYPGVRSGSVQ